MRWVTAAYACSHVRLASTCARASCPRRFASAGSRAARCMAAPRCSTLKSAHMSDCGTKRSCDMNELEPTEHGYAVQGTLRPNRPVSQPQPAEVEKRLI
jgi:hypothetical protein